MAMVIFLKNKVGYTTQKIKLYLNMIKQSTSVLKQVKVVKVVKVVSGHDTSYLEMPKFTFVVKRTNKLCLQIGN